MNPQILKIEDDLHKRAEKIVDEYFNYLREEEEREPAKKHQITGLLEVFKQGGIKEALAFANKQLNKKTVKDDDGLKKFWEKIKIIIEKELKGLDDANCAAFFESFCCHYYYSLNHDVKSEKIIGEKGHSTSTQKLKSGGKKR